MRLITIICLFIALAITLVSVNANKTDASCFLQKTPMKLNKKSDMGISKREPLGRPKMLKMKLGKEPNMEPMVMPEIHKPDLNTPANKIQQKSKFNSLKMSHKLGPKMRMLKPLSMSDVVISDDHHMKPIKMNEKNSLKTNSFEKKAVKRFKKLPVQMFENEPPQMSEKKPVQINEKEPAQINEKEQVQVFENEPVQMSEQEPVQMSEKEPAQMNEKEQVQVVEKEHVPVSEKDKFQMNEKEQVHVFENKPVRVVQKEQTNLIKKMPINMFDAEPIETFEIESTTMPELESTTIFEYELKQSTIMLPTESDSPVTEWSLFGPVPEPKPIVVIEKEPENIQTQKPGKKHKITLSHETGQQTNDQVENQGIAEKDIIVRESDSSTLLKNKSPKISQQKLNTVNVFESELSGTEKAPPKVQTKKPRKNHRITLSHETDRQTSDEVENQHTAENQSINMGESDSSTLLKNKSPKLPQQKVTMVKGSESELSGTEWEQSEPVIVTEKAPPKVQTQNPSKMHKIALSHKTDRQTSDEVESQNNAESETMPMRESDLPTILKTKSPKQSKQKLTIVKESESELSGTEWEQSAPVIVTEKAVTCLTQVQTQKPRRKHKIVIMQETDSQNTDELDNEATKIAEKHRSANISRNKQSDIRKLKSVKTSKISMRQEIHSDD